jgi:UDP-2,3-diacylglucosamine pyrophosphatase LpxH
VDHVTSTQPWLAKVGDLAYSAALWGNRGLNLCRKAAGLEYRSFSQSLKQQVKEAVNYVSGFEKKLVAEARRFGTDGVICGHIHKAAWQKFQGRFLYGNCGDWVESCSTLVEHHDGRMELLDWEALQERIGVPVVTKGGEMVYRFPLEGPAPSWTALPVMDLDPVETPGFFGQNR